MALALFFAICVSASSLESASLLDSLESGSTGFGGAFEGYRLYINKFACETTRKTDLAVDGFRGSG